MRLLAATRLWLRALFTRRRAESEMDREIRLHLELETEENVRRGMSPAEARRAAVVAFGGVEKTKEAVRDERQTRWLEEIAADLRFAARGYRQHSGFSITAIVLLAVGIGANVALFSIIHHLILQPLPFPDGNRMVLLRATGAGGAISIGPRERFVDAWRASAHAVTAITVFDERSFLLGDTTSTPERVNGAAIPPGALSFADTRPVLGRDIVPSDTLAGAPPVAILAFNLWQRLFGGSDDVLSRTVLLDGTPHRIIGVTPRGFVLPFTDADAVFTALPPALGSDRTVTAVAKLRDGTGTDVANRELARLFAVYPRTADQVTTNADAPRVAGAVDLLSKRLRQIVEILFGAVGFVLLIVCANVANLMLARGWSRQREFAVRSAMGGSAARLARQVLTESMFLAVIAGALSLAVATVSLNLMVLAQPPHSTELDGAQLNGAVLVWSIIVSFGSALICGVAPAFWLARTGGSEALKQSARTASGSRAARRFRSSLVVIEVALSVVLLVGAGLLVRTLVAMQRTDYGLEPRGLTAVGIRLSDPRLTPLARQTAMAAAITRLRAMPGVDGVTLAMAPPPGYVTVTSKLAIEGRALGATDSLAGFALNGGTGEFFRVLGMRVTQGRVFRSDATLEPGQTPTEAVVNESFARRFWPDGNAVGARIRPFSQLGWATIIGVVGDVRVPGWERRVDQLQLYLPSSASPTRGVLLVRSTQSIGQLVPAVTRVFHEINPIVKVGSSASIQGEFDHFTMVHRFTLKLLGAFAALALVIALVGLHGVVAYSVNERASEIGVRLALGATAAGVLSLVMKQALRLTAVGIVAGLAAGVLAARALRTLLYSVGTGDPITLASVAGVLAIGALVAAFVPARRAASLDPAQTLRAE